jgi:hypothetical protein
MTKDIEKYIIKYTYMTTMVQREVILYAYDVEQVKAMFDEYSDGAGPYQIDEIFVKVE